MIDVLGFVDSRRAKPLGEGHSGSREITVNGVLLATLATQAYGHEVDPVTPLVDDYPQLAPDFLAALTGGPVNEELRTGRVALGYCPVCLDSSCGSLFAATLLISELNVEWRDLGYEEECFGTFEKRFGGRLGYFRAISHPPEEWWLPDPIRPELHFTFDRSQYECAVNAELDRVGAKK